MYLKLGDILHMMKIKNVNKTIEQWSIKSVEN